MASLVSQGLGERRPTLTVTSFDRGRNARPAPGSSQRLATKVPLSRHHNDGVGFWSLYTLLRKETLPHASSEPVLPAALSLLGWVGMLGLRMPAVGVLAFKDKSPG